MFARGSCVAMPCRAVVCPEQEVVLQAKMLGLANGGPGEIDSAAGFLSQVKHVILVSFAAHAACYEMSLTRRETLARFSLEVICLERRKQDRSILIRVPRLPGLDNNFFLHKQLPLLSRCVHILM